MKADFSSDQVQLKVIFSGTKSNWSAILAVTPTPGDAPIIVATYPDPGARYISLVSSSFSIIQLLARITGRRNTRPRAKDGIR